MRTVMVLLATMFLVPTAQAGEHYRWQATPTFTEHRSHQIMGVELLLWPERPIGGVEDNALTHFEVHVEHTSPSKLVSEFSGEVQAAPSSGYPIDLYVLADLGDGKTVDDVRDVVAEVHDAFGTVPPSSTLKILTFPFKGDGQGAGGDKQPLSSSVRLNSSLQTREDWQEVPSSSKHLAPTADLDDALVRTLQHMEGAVTASPERVRAVIYLSITNPTVGRQDRVAAASHRLGNVPIFSIFRKQVPEYTRTVGIGLRNQVGKTAINIAGPYIAAGFHHAVPQQTGGWVLSGDLEAVAKQRREHGSEQDQKRRAAERELKKRRGLVAKYERQLVSKKEKLKVIAVEQVARREKVKTAISGLQSKIEALRAQGLVDKPIAEEPTPFQAFLRSVFAQLSHPLHIRTDLPCARGTASGAEPTRLSLKLGGASDVSFAKPIGGCTDAHGSSTLCVYPGRAFIAAPPSLDELIIHSPDGEQFSSKSIDSTEAMRLSASMLSDDDSELLLEVRGTALCGDGELRARLLQHNGVEGPPHVFSEAFPPPESTLAPSSRQRFFRVFNLGEAIRHLKLSVHFQSDASRSKPGNQLRLPSVLFDSRFFPGRWASEVFVLLLLLLVFFGASRALRKKEEVRKTRGLPSDAAPPSS